MIRLCPVLLLLAAPTLAIASPPVYVYHDDQYASFGYLDPPKAITLQHGEFWPVAVGDIQQAMPFHRALMQALASALTSAGHPTQTLDAPGWLRLCQTRQRAVVIDICETVPDLVFRGQPDSPLRAWLEAGGILIYSGDWPFYWYCDATGKTSNQGAGPLGDDAVFGEDLVQEDFVGISTAATETGRQWLPSLRPTWALRPFNLDAVKAHCKHAEFYLTGDRQQAGATQHAADGLAFQVPHGQGWFAGFHLTRGPHTDTAQVILEFVTRRLDNLTSNTAGDAK